MSKKGGYVIVDLKGQSITAGTPFTLDGVTARLNRAKNKACLLSGFAIGDEEKRDVFIDLQKTDDGYVALFGQYTLTINDDEVTITDGGVLLDNIVDSQGNKRFIEGSGTIVTANTQGITFTYNKWSLSGTHLMLVLCGEFPAETVLGNGLTWASFSLPSWILKKITPGADNIVDIKENDFYNSAYDLVKNKFYLTKVSNSVNIGHISTYTAVDKRAFRIQFELLIDSEAE